MKLAIIIQIVLMQQTHLKSCALLTLVLVISWVCSLCGPLVRVITLNASKVSIRFLERVT